MSVELSACMAQGGGFLRVRDLGDDQTLAIEVEDRDSFNPEQDIAVLILKSSLGMCVQDHYLGLIVFGQAHLWAEEESSGGNGWLASYFDEQGRRLMDFTSWGQGGEVESFLDDEPT